MYRGHLLLFQTHEFSAGNPRHVAEKWQTLCTHPVEAHVIPGNHMTALNAPHVQVLAQKMGTAFDRVMGD